MLRMLAVVVALCTACGRLGFDPTRGDAMDGASPDGAPDIPLGAPTLVSEFATAVPDDDPTVTDDLLEIYFCRGDNPGL